MPTKFARSIERLSNEDRLLVFDSLLKIGKDETINIPDSAAGDIITLIYGEWMNMESRNSSKTTVNHISGSPGTNVPSDPVHIIEYNRVEYNTIEENNISQFSDKNEGELKEFNQEALETGIEERTVTQQLSVCFFDLGYVPAKEETVYSLREWISGIAKLKGKTAEQMIDTINSWHAYWKGNKKPVKNHKASLLNHYSLKGK